MRRAGLGVGVFEDDSPQAVVEGHAGRGGHWLDSLAQAGSQGEVGHAVREGLVDVAGVHELGAIAAGRAPGRSSEAAITVCDLTGIGAVRSGWDLLEVIIYPSASFVPGHEVYRVETDREVYTGVRGESSGDAVVIISGPRERVRIPRKEIRSMRPATVSLMPDGFGDDLTRQELADLLAFLQAQERRGEVRTNH